MSSTIATAFPDTPTAMDAISRLTRETSVPAGAVRAFVHTSHHADIGPFTPDDAPESPVAGITALAHGELDRMSGDPPPADDVERILDVYQDALRDGSVVVVTSIHGTRTQRHTALDTLARTAGTAPAPPDTDGPAPKGTPHIPRVVHGSVGSEHGTIDV